MPDGGQYYPSETATVGGRIPQREDGYVFVNWNTEKEGTGTSYNPNDKFIIEENTTLYAQWRPASNTEYTVEYYYQENGRYSDQATKSVKRYGTTDTEITVTAEDKIPEKEGYVYDTAAANVESGNIAGDGSLVLKVYFKEQFTVAYEPGDHGTFEPQTTGGLDYGTETPGFDGETTGDAGYTFAGWAPEVAETVTGSATYVAQWSADTDTKYTVEYYYQKDGAYPEDASDSEERTGTTDTLASVTAEDKIPTEDGYVYDTAAANVESGNIAGDGSLVLKVYFKEQFTVTYEPGTHGTFESQTKGGLDYGTETPGFEGETTGAAGYTFAGWSPAVAETVTESATYVAQWSADTDTKYTVEYYYQQYDGSYPEIPTFTDEREGTTDTQVSVTDTDKEPMTGFAYDENAANVESGIVAGDGSLVLKLHFYRATFNYLVVEHYENADGEEVGTIKTPGTAVFEEAILELSGVTVTQNKEYEGHNYYLTGVDGYDKLVSADETQNEVHIYYALDEIGGKDPENPNTPDGIPDKYQTTVMFAAVNGTVDGKTQAEKVVTLTDADGNWSEDGSYTLTEEDIPEAVAAIGYDQATATWDSENPATPAGSVIDMGEDTKVTFTVTFSPADQTYIVQYIDEDTNEGLKEQDVFNAKYGDYINGEDHAIDFEGYTFTRATELWVTEDNQINYVFIYYSKDEIGPDGPDDIPDKYQLAFTYISADEATGTVTGKTVEVKTFRDEAGNYTEVQPTSPTTMDGHNPVPEAADGYAFAYWTEEGGDERDYTLNMTYTLGQKEYTEDTTFVAHFLKDEGGTEDPDQPDGTPDEYQIKFTYVTEDPAHGTFGGVNEVSEVLDRPTNDDGSTNMEEGVSPTVNVTITENGRYRFDHWTDAAGTEYTTEELQQATFTTDATFTAHFRYISSSGGNGGGSGSSGGTGPYTPSTGGPGAAIIDDDNVPLAPLPTENNGGNVVIFDDSVPLAPLPKTGQQSSKTPVTMLLTGIFLMFVSLRKRKEEKQ